MILLTISFLFYLHRKYHQERNHEEVKDVDEKLRILCIFMHFLNFSSLFIISFTTYGKLCISSSQCYIICIVMHMTMLKDKLISDIFLGIICLMSVIITLCVYETMFCIEIFETILWYALSKLIIHLVEMKHEKVEEIVTNQDMLSSSFNQILDNIPSGILFCTKQGVVKANKFWFKMQKKLSRFYRKSDSDENIHNHVKESKEIIGNEKAYEMLKHFKCAKSNQISLQDIVRGIVSKRDSLFVNPLQDFFKVFNSSFVEEQKDANDVRDEITKDFTRNTAHLQEVTVVCSLFNPPKEYNAYIYLILPEEENKGKKYSINARAKAKYSEKKTQKPLDPNSVMIVLSDISERVDLKASQISEKMKTIMFCSISHELRSPLNHITGVHSILKTKLDKKEQKELMRIAESSTEVLKMKIDDILDFYEVESGNFSIQKLQFDVRNQCKELESVFLPLMNEKRTKLLFYVNEQTPKLIIHDACRIHKILVNLISNSVKYTKNGAVVVTIDWKEIDGRNVNSNNNIHYQIKYTVSDTGCGISKEKKLLLFKFLDPINSLVNSKTSLEPTTTSLAGTGLGISQKIANMLGTKIEYISTVNVGSTFWFSVDITDKFVPIERKEEKSIPHVEYSTDKKSARGSGLVKKISRIDKQYTIKRNTCMEEEDKYDNISSNEVKSKMQICIPQENSKLSHLVKKLSSKDSITLNQVQRPILSKEMPKEIVEASDESISESSVAGEDFKVNCVPQFLISAGVHNPDLRKFMRVTARKRKQSKHVSLLRLSKCNLENKLRCRSYAKEKEIVADPDLSIISFERDKNPEVSKDNSKSIISNNKAKRNTTINPPDLLNSFNFTKVPDMTPAANNKLINLEDSDESDKNECFEAKLNQNINLRPPKLIFRKIVSQKDNIKANQQLEFSVNNLPKSRSRSICLMRRKIKFAEMIDIDTVEIQPMFKKACGCASILVVDDQYINRFIIVKYAEKYGIICDEAEDGEEAVIKCKQAGEKNCCKGYNLVLMDLNMPIMGGIESTIEIIKCKQNHMVSQCIEIIAVTAFVSEKEKEKCLSIGMSDFIPKPFTITDFVRLIGIY